MNDTAVLVALLLSFATFVTAHIAIAGRLLFRREDRWRGLVVVVAPPLAFLWAVRRGWRASAALWAGSVVVYAVALLAALR